jgi:hypothetical protein
MIEEEIEYNPDTGEFFYKKPSHGRTLSKPAGSIQSTGYRMVCVNSKRYLAHRLAWYLYYGEWPTLTIDHLNRDRSDNRICNLRLATRSQNQCNRPSKGYSHHKNSGKFQARIHINGKTTYLGWYDTEEEARQAFLAAQDQYHGQYAYKGE